MLPLIWNLQYIKLIGVSHTACKDEFRRNLRSHSWSVFSFFIIKLERYIKVMPVPTWYILPSAATSVRYMFYLLEGGTERLRWHFRAHTEPAPVPTHLVFFEHGTNWVSRINMKHMCYTVEMQIFFSGPPRVRREHLRRVLRQRGAPLFFLRYLNFGA